jgi:hypothetical protein
MALEIYKNLDLDILKINYEVKMYTKTYNINLLFPLDISISY